MRRRLLSLVTILSLLAGFFAAPGVPTLVCRMTGQPMKAVLATPLAERSCCTVNLSAGANGAPRYTLVQPGCCDLRQSLSTETPTANLSLDPDFALVALLPSLPTVPAAFSPTVLVRPPLTDGAPPRAPPLFGLSSRAPPTNS